MHNAFDSRFSFTAVLAGPIGNGKREDSIYDVLPNIKDMITPPTKKYLDSFHLIKSLFKVNEPKIKKMEKKSIIFI